MLFDSEAYAQLVERVRSRGCELPIIPGIQPITNLRQVTRFAELSGQSVPDPVVARLQSVPADQVRATGIAMAVELCEALLDYGVPGLHFYTQNRSSASREIYARLHPELHPA